MLLKVLKIIFNTYCKMKQFMMILTRSYFQTSNSTAWALKAPRRISHS